MSTITEPEIVLTPEDAAAASGDILFELVDGRLVEKNMSAISTTVAGEVAFLLKLHCRSPLTARVLPEQSFACFPRKPRQMRRPDVSLILAARMTAERLREGVSTIRPDLVVEVVSPNDLVEDLEEKLDDFRDAQIPLVWIVYPSMRKVRVIRLDGTTSVFGLEDELTGEDLLPGFRCRVADFFVELPEIKAASQA